MDKKTQLVEPVKQSPGSKLIEQRLFWGHHKPSWKRYGDGWASMEVTAAPGAWLQIWSTEGTSGEAHDSSKQVLHVLSVEQVRALRALCDVVLSEPEVAEGR